MLVLIIKANPIGTTNDTERFFIVRPDLLRKFVIEGGNALKAVSGITSSITPDEIIDKHKEATGEDYAYIIGGMFTNYATDELSEFIDLLCKKIDTVFDDHKEDDDDLNSEVEHFFAEVPDNLLDCLKSAIQDEITPTLHVGERYFNMVYADGIDYYEMKGIPLTTIGDLIENVHAFNSLEIPSFIEE